MDLIGGERDERSIEGTIREYEVGMFARVRIRMYVDLEVDLLGRYATSISYKLSISVRTFELLSLHTIPT